MRILYNSKLPEYKDPFGTLTPGSVCRLNIHIPVSVHATAVVCNLTLENGEPYSVVELHKREVSGLYEVFSGEFSLDMPGLFFYFFHISTRNGGFRLFKQGDDTNMEAGDLWQVSCIDADFATPDWAKGAVIYQIFPDRFHKAGSPDLTGKLEPYTVHRDWYEEVSWQPTPEGHILNNDFYGGNFRGIQEKLGYLSDLGVTILYLNPISKAFSSHRYDTADYKTPDPMLGTEADFATLCDTAHARGMRVILDGVYSHTGSNSLYFNKNGAFDSKGAFNDPNSPYHEWYTFYHYPNSYNSWWNFDTLPTVRKMTPSFVDYVITGEDSVVAHWLKLGADGFRLDVVDELPDEFVLLLKKRIRQIKPDALLIGEVWEDASNKIAYGKRRRYFVDGELDSPMNYPLRTAIINFMRGYDDGHGLRGCVMTLAENYPPQVMACTMNLLGTHDTPRILTALIGDFDGDREARAQHHLSGEQWITALDRLRTASFLQYTLPGAPSIYYGDEAGMEGCADPFCRRPFPWGRESVDLLRHFRQLGRLRQTCEALRCGDIRFFRNCNRQIGFSRSYRGQTLKIYVNQSGESWTLEPGSLLLGRNLQTVSPDELILGSNGYCVVEEPK